MIGPKNAGKSRPYSTLTGVMANKMKPSNLAAFTRFGIFDMIIR